MHAHNEIIVNDKIIEYAERILLPNGMHFDKERRDYLRDFTTLDLKAVPGSGKTTLLLAKLIILEQSLPLNSGCSVLVLSHTNAAVDEINDRLKKHCPKLFTYPNFIGTIQSFVNKYLATPYFESCMDRKVISIDAELYNKVVERKYENIPERSAFGIWLNQQHDPVSFLKSLRFDEQNRLIKYIDGTADKFPLKDSCGKSYKALVKFKMSIWRKGVLQFDDAYFFAQRYMARDDKIISILRKRFGYVFVDEMQDMDVHQYNILEIFNAPEVCFQRLGDNNQAIYSNIVYGNNIWYTRENTMVIHGSYRLTNKNANLASRFGIDGTVIDGLNTENTDTKPVLIIFDENSCTCKVIRKFSAYVASLPDFENLNIVEGFKVVAWRKEHEKNYLSLKEYCPKYLQMSEDETELEQSNISYNIVKDIYNWIADIFYFEQVHYLGEIITRTSVKNIVRNLDIYNDVLEGLIYKIVVAKISDNLPESKEATVRFLETTLFSLGTTDERIKEIIAGIEVMPIVLNEITSTEDEEQCVDCNIGDTRPIIGTVHSVKGETHSITLFLESYYNGKFESDILSKVISGESNVNNLIESEKKNIEKLNMEIQGLFKSGNKRGIKTRLDKVKKHNIQIGRLQQYSKLVYVALSRAKGIVGYGMCKSKFEDLFDKEKVSEEWDIIFVE